MDSYTGSCDVVTKLSRGLSEIAQLLVYNDSRQA